MNLYLNNGYADIKKILGQGYPFTFVIGGRATGKTYGALKTVIEEEKTFFLMRRMQNQCDLINVPEFSPLTPVCEDMGLTFETTKLTKTNAALHIFKPGDEPSGNPQGVTGALSTIANTRGFDGSWIDLLLYDEFIPEHHERTMRDEYQAFCNAYETINRNREMQGRKPLQALLLSNSNDIASPLLIGFGLINPIRKAMAAGRNYYKDDRRGIFVALLSDSRISEAKAHTALYKAQTQDNAFSRMSLRNTFDAISNSRIKSLPIKQIKPVVRVGEIDIGTIKGDGRYYVTTNVLSCPEAYGTSDIELTRFASKYACIRRAHLQDQIIFETETLEILLARYMQI